MRPDICDLKTRSHHERRLHPIDLEPREALQRRPPAAGPRAARRRLERAGRHRPTSARQAWGTCRPPRRAAGTAGGFKVGLTADATDLTLSAGRLYVDGILCELGAETTYTAQLAALDPAFAKLDPPPLPARTGSYFVFADVWQRHVTVLEDRAIRETALGGPDTATRTQTCWQVKLFPVDAGSHCLSAPQDWLDATAAPTGRLRARTRPGEPPKEPCIVPANAGYTRLENQLYRVEVHQGGDQPTFKWSRDNGSVASEWLPADTGDPKKLRVGDTGRDKVSGFAPGGWVEVTDDGREIQGQPGVLAKLLDVTGNVLTLDLAEGTTLQRGIHPKVRRWDSQGETVISPRAGDDGWLPLEDGVEVRFEPGTYRTGDYWLIPARAFIGEFSGDVEWPQDPQDGQPAALPPAGVAHHFCKLAVADFAAAAASAKRFSNLRDCRRLFPAVTELVQLSYVGGDGQAAGPGEMLPQPLEVRVANGGFPQIGAQVRFHVREGKGRLTGSRGAPATDPTTDPTVSTTDATIAAMARASGTGGSGGGIQNPDLVVLTDADGLAACFWTFGDDPGDPRQRVEAVLLDAAGNPVPGQAVHFNAGHRQGRDPGIAVRGVFTLADKKPLDNDSQVNVARLLAGFLVTTDRKLADVFSFPLMDVNANQPPFPPKPSFQVILHMPFSQGAGVAILAPSVFVPGFQPFLLAGGVSLADPGVQWIPTVQCRRWLQTVLLQQLDPNRTPGFRLLVQVILKGKFIWSADDADVFLDGEGFGRRGGDFEMWFWLVQDPIVDPVNPVNPVDAADASRASGSSTQQKG